MFLDEPTSGLDPVAAHEVDGLICALRDRGVTIFLTTHRLDEAERLCDRVAIMNTQPANDRPARRAAPEAVLQVAGRHHGGAAGPSRSGLRRPARGPGLAGHRPGSPAGYVLTVSDPARAAPAVTRALVAAGADVLSIAESRHTLEDVYLELIEDTEGRTR